MIMKKRVFLILLFLTLSASPTPQVEAQESTGAISFQPSEMPNLSFNYNVAEYRFELTWKGYYLNLEPFAIYNGQTLEFKQIIPWLRNNYPQVNYRWAVTKFKNYHRWGYWLESLPQNVADNLDYLGFRLDYNFPLSAVNIEWEETENYTFPRIQLGNVITLDFADLYEHGFNLEVNKTHMMIGNVKGKTDLDLDPITYSAPTITVTGFTEGTPCNFWDLWNASNVNGWGVVHNNNNNNTQYQIDCKLTIGDGSTFTWFADTNVQVFFNLTGQTIPAFLLYNKATVRFGEIVDASDKTSKNGVQVHADLDHYQELFRLSSGAEVNVYSSHIWLEGTCFVNEYGNGAVWNTIVIGGAGGFSKMTSGGSWDFYRLNFEKTTTPFDRNTVTLNDVLFTDTQYGSYFYGNTTPSTEYTYRNLRSKNIASGILNINKANSTVYLIDNEHEPWKMRFIKSPLAIVYRQYSFNVLVVNSTGNPIENATATLLNAYGDTVFTELTAGSGSIAEQIVSSGHYNQTGGNTLYDYGPFQLVVTYAGSTETIANIALDDPIDWVVVIEEEGIFIILLFAGIILSAIIFGVMKRR